MTYTRVQHDQGDQLDVLGDRYRVIADTDQTDGSFAAVEVTIGPGNGVPPHVDNSEAIGWYVIEGRLEFMVAGEDGITVDAGGWIYSPKGVLHTFRNPTESTVRALLLAVPSGLEGFFREVGRSLTSDDDPRPPTEDDIGRVLQVAPSYGLNILTPA